jgi:hypothetical protein
MTTRRQSPWLPTHLHFRSILKSHDFSYPLELIEEEVIATIVPLVFKQGVVEVLIEVRRISHPAGSRLEVATRLRPALVVWRVVVGEVVVWVVIHAVDIISLGCISTTKEHPQAEQTGQEQRNAASEHD